MKSNLLQIKFCLLGVLASGLLFSSCEKSSSEGSQGEDSTAVENSLPEIVRPPFNADSAFVYVEKQVAFGPRVPNTPAHKKCADYFVQFFKSQGAEVTVQEAKVKDHLGTNLDIKNIIASYNPNAQRRIMLSAHWDSRPRADEDSVKQNLPIDGANDGASGVAVLMEIARQLKNSPPNVGIDLFLWDAEDGGTSGNNESWCLGSQYWANNPHKKGYRADYGINLDMVGAAKATFPKELYSNTVAPQIVQKVWQTAHQLGHGAYFPMYDHGTITDDHYFVHKITQIPYIDVIHIKVGSNDRTFFEHWHTHGDKLTIIDPKTLQAVGETILAVVKSEK